MGSSECLGQEGREEELFNECSCQAVGWIASGMRRGGAWYLFHYLLKFMQTSLVV